MDGSQAPKVPNSRLRYYPTPMHNILKKENKKENIHRGGVKREIQGVGRFGPPGTLENPWYDWVLILSLK